jgi:predicted bacteriocin transport accessory protein
MKKMKIVVLLLFAILIFSGCSKSNDSYLKDLSFNELKEKLNNKDEFFFVVTQDGCSHCESFIPVLESTLNKEKIVGYNFNLSKLSEDDNKKFEELFKIDGTPTTIFIKDGQEISILQRIYGEASEEQIIQKLKNNGYIK